MKLIVAMKQLKDLAKKAEDLRGKVAMHCSNLSIETMSYPDQAATVAGWLQAHEDLLDKILELRVALQRTNIVTPVTIELEGRQVTKTIAAWIQRRKDLAKLAQQMWAGLGDRNLKESNVQSAAGGAVTEVRIRRFFNPVQRDEKVAAYRSEPSIIDANLEIVNAVTDLIES
jgi:hypothetical protein